MFQWLRNRKQSHLIGIAGEISMVSQDLAHACPGASWVFSQTLHGVRGVINGDGTRSEKINLDMGFTVLAIRYGIRTLEEWERSPVVGAFWSAALDKMAHSHPYRDECESDFEIITDPVQLSPIQCN